MPSNEGGVVRWLFGPDTSPTSETQADELARSIIRHDVPPTPMMWHPSFGAAIDQELDLRDILAESVPDANETCSRHEATRIDSFGPPEGTASEGLEGKVIQGPWLRS